MVASARSIKQKYPNAGVVFIGPCAAKKLEASRTDVRSDVDFVITFEELQGMFDAKEIDPALMEEDGSLHNATAAGRGYAVAGGVAQAIEECLQEYHPNVPVHIEHAEGLAECKSAHPSQGRQNERMSHRRHGLSRRMYGGSGNQHSVKGGGSGVEEV